MFRGEEQHGAEVKANVFTLQMQSMESCLQCRGANVFCVLSTFGLVWLQGLEIQPASPVLPAHRGHPGLPEPSAGETRVRRNLWGPVPQLHTGAPAHSLLPADLRAGVGEIQRGKGDLAVSPCLPPLFQCLCPPPQHYFIRCALTNVTMLFERVLHHQSHCLAHFSPVTTSVIHASCSLISIANLQLLDPGQSRVTHHRRSLWAHFALAAFFSSALLLIYLWLCWNLITLNTSPWTSHLLLPLLLILNQTDTNAPVLWKMEQWVARLLAQAL